MPTSGLVITLHADQALASDTSKAIDRLPGLTLGEPVDGHFLPATIQAPQRETTEAITTIESLEGVQQVAITWIGLDAPVDSPHDTTPREIPS
ncbi:MAG: hypothetical protein QGG74_04230 [Phycisphaerales bacterium]|jgi:hypothetical protein|nr:hypothetical protein [Phycisphaerales bacterium]